LQKNNFDLEEGVAAGADARGKRGGLRERSAEAEEALSKTGRTRPAEYRLASGTACILSSPLEKKSRQNYPKERKALHKLLATRLWAAMRLPREPFAGKGESIVAGIGKLIEGELLARHPLTQKPPAAWLLRRRTEKNPSVEFGVSH